MTWDGITLTSPNGGTIALNEKAKKEFEKATKNSGRVITARAGNRADTPLDGGPDPDVASGAGTQQIWYGDPAEHPHAYIAVTYEDTGVLVRDGGDPNGATLQFSHEQWAALTDPTDEGLGDPQGDPDNPAEVRHPDELYKVDRGKRNR